MYWIKSYEAMRCSGEKFTLKKLQSQVNQVYVRMVVLNKSTALGRLQSKVVL